MAWPQLSDYSDAVQDPRNFEDADLRAGRVVTTAQGLPRPAAGRFACVYEVRSPAGARFAVRCFSQKVTDQQRRYQLLTDHLAGFTSPYLVGFTFLERGILVRGAWYPIVKMDWVDGRPLNMVVEDALAYPGTLLSLAKQWRALIAAVRGLSMAHGDLQHGNVLVTPQGDVRLVDYDGMFVPAMQGEKAPELGHPNYQHPKRAERHFNEDLDGFAALEIFLGLRALASDRTLWQRFNDDDNLVLKKADFENPARSPAVGALRASKDPIVRGLTDHLLRFCAVEPDQVPPLEEVLRGFSPKDLFPPALLRKAKPRAAAAPASPPPQPQPVGPPPAQTPQASSSPIRLTLQPRLSCDPYVQAGPMFRGSPGVLSLKVRNTGGGMLTVRAACRDPWVQPVQPVVTVAREGFIQFRVDTRACGVGEKTTFVDISSNGGNAFAILEFDVVSRAASVPQPLASGWARLREAPRWVRASVGALGVVALLSLVWPSGSRGRAPAPGTAAPRPTGWAAAGATARVSASPPAVPGQEATWVSPVEVAASSVWPPEPELSSTAFGPEKVVDGSPFTAWASMEREGTPWLEVNFGRQEAVDGLAMASGWTSPSNTHWVRHPAVVKVRLQFDSGPDALLDLPPGPSFWTVASFPRRETSRIRLVVLATRLGEDAGGHEAVISELWYRSARSPHRAVPARPYHGSIPIEDPFEWFDGRQVSLAVSGSLAGEMGGGTWEKEGPSCALRRGRQAVAKAPAAESSAAMAREMAKLWAGRWESENREWVMELDVKADSSLSGRVAHRFRGEECPIRDGVIEDADRARFAPPSPMRNVPASATIRRQADGSLVVRAQNHWLPRPDRFWKAAPLMPGKVMGVRGRNVTVGLGKKDGVREGTYLAVVLAHYPVHFEGKLLGHEETELVVRSVEEETCDALPVDPEELLPASGDVVRMMQQQDGPPRWVPGAGPSRIRRR